MKLSRSYLIYTAIILAGMLLVPYLGFVDQAKAYDFEWEENSVNDNVDYYQIYWRLPDGDYHDSQKKIVGDDDGDSEDGDADTIVTATYQEGEGNLPLPGTSETVCFVVTAVNTNDEESDYSNQACTGAATQLNNGFSIETDDYTAFTISGWARSNATVDIEISDHNGDIRSYTTNADEYGAWSIVIDFTGYPEGNISIQIKDFKAGDIEMPEVVVTGILDSVTPSFLSGPGALGVTDQRATIVLTTNEDTIVSLDYWRAGEEPESQNQDFASIHSFDLSGLELETTYYYQVTAVDTGGNNINSNEQTFITGQTIDSDPPQITNIQVVDRKDTSATISWNVDEYSDSVMRYGTPPGECNTYPLPGVSDSGDGLRTITLTGLAETTDYGFCIDATDTTGNATIDVAGPEFTTTEDIYFPVINEASIDVEVEDTKATITWTTDETSDSQVQYGLTQDLDLSEPPNDPILEDVFNHRVLLTALIPSRTYYFQVLSGDRASNLSSSDIKTFTTLADAKPPVIQGTPTASVTDTTATIIWTTDEESKSSVQYGTASSIWNNYQLSRDDINLNTQHNVTLNGLSPDTNYFYRVGVTDGQENGPTVSSEYGFRTAPTVDNDPPQFTSPPTVTGKTGTTAVIEWSTDEASTSLVRYGLEQTGVTGSAYATWDDYPSSQNSAELVTNHAVTLTNLESDTKYYIRVRSIDALENPPAESVEISFNTDQVVIDEDRPRVTLPPTVTGITNTSATIEWQTDEPANGEVRFDTSELNWQSYRSVVIDSRVDTAHRVVLTNLDPETRYYFRVGSTDTAGNGPNDDQDETNNPFSEDMFTTLPNPDITAPRIISGPQVVSASVDDDTAIIIWETDEPSNSLVQYGTGGTNWQDLTSSATDGDMVTQHSVTLTGLKMPDQDTTIYFYMVGSQDAAGNGPFVNDNNTNPSDRNSFETKSSQDNSAPVISAVNMSFATNSTALITWTTDEPSNSIVQYSPVDPDTPWVTSNWEGYAYEESDAEMRTEHSVTITNLQTKTTYFFRIASMDAKGNGPTYNPNSTNPSAENGFITEEFPDTTAPQIAGDVVISVNVAERTVLVTWTTPDEPGNSQVQYDTTSQSWGGYAFAENDDEFDRSHSVTLTNLEVNTIYYLRASSVDASGNNYNVNADDNNPSNEYNFYLESIDSPDPESPDDPVKAIQAELERAAATCYIHSVRDDVPVVKTAMVVVGVLFGVFSLLAIVRLRRQGKR